MIDSRDIYGQRQRHRETEKRRNVVGDWREKVEKGGKGENEKTRLFLSSFFVPRNAYSRKKRKSFFLEENGENEFFCCDSPNGEADENLRL